MDAEVRKMAKLPWSDANIKSICKGKVNVMTVKAAVQKGSIDEVFGPHGAAVLLFETEPDYGHWVALIRVDDDTVEWFDSYGIEPNGELKMIPRDFAKESKQDAPYLTDMIEKGGYTTVLWNQTPLQKHGEDVSTCGRWASLRVAFKHLALEDFIRLFLRQKQPPDMIVSYLTAFTA